MESGFRWSRRDGRARRSVESDTGPGSRLKVCIRTLESTPRSYSTFTIDGTAEPSPVAPIMSPTPEAGTLNNFRSMRMKPKAGDWPDFFLSVIRPGPTPNREHTQDRNFLVLWIFDGLTPNTPDAESDLPSTSCSRLTSHTSFFSAHPFHLTSSFFLFTFSSSLR